jgi:hypothetical protein
MDLSKLPKLSDTQSQAPPVAPAPVEPFQPPGPSRSQTMDYRPGERQIGVGVDIWISLVIGLLLLMMGASFGKYALASLRHQPYHTNVNWTSGPKDGTEVAYFELEGYTALSDMGIFLFGAMLLAEAAAKFLLLIKPGTLSKAFLILATLLTAGTTLLNVYAALKMFSAGILPMIAVLAIAFGGWILFDEVTTLQRVQSGPRKVPLRGDR